MNSWCSHQVLPSGMGPLQLTQWFLLIIVNCLEVLKIDIKNICIVLSTDIRSGCLDSTLKVVMLVTIHTHSVLCVLCVLCVVVLSARLVISQIYFVCMQRWPDPDVWPHGVAVMGWFTLLWSVIKATTMRLRAVILGQGIRSCTRRKNKPAVKGKYRELQYCVSFVTILCLFCNTVWQPVEKNSWNWL